MSRDNLIVGLDIGTTKIGAIIAEITNDGAGVNIVGVGKSPSYGLRRGVVVNIEKTVQSITSAVEEAELGDFERAGHVEAPRQGAAEGHGGATGAVIQIEFPHDFPLLV